jgi:hypothetical protein
MVIVLIFLICLAGVNNSLDALDGAKTSNVPEGANERHPLRKRSFNPPLALRVNETTSPTGVCGGYQFLNFFGIR